MRVRASRVFVTLLLMQDFLKRIMELDRVEWLKTHRLQEAAGRGVLVI